MVGQVVVLNDDRFHNEDIINWELCTVPYAEGRVYIVKHIGDLYLEMRL
jgi:hypothetical protein